MTCSCVRCPECKGTGNVWFAAGGRHYLGSSRWDDLDEMENCEYCRGTGFISLCDECFSDQDEEEDDWPL